MKRYNPAACDGPICPDPAAAEMVTSAPGIEEPNFLMGLMALFRTAFTVITVLHVHGIQCVILWSLVQPQGERLSCSCTDSSTRGAAINMNSIGDAKGPDELYDGCTHVPISMDIICMYDA